jgi:hypothetical protein
MTDGKYKIFFLKFKNSEQGEPSAEEVGAFTVRDGNLVDYYIPQLKEVNLKRIERIFGSSPYYTIIRS